MVFSFTATNKTMFLIKWHIIEPDDDNIMKEKWSFMTINHLWLSIIAFQMVIKFTNWFFYTLIDSQSIITSVYGKRPVSKKILFRKISVDSRIQTRFNAMILTTFSIDSFLKWKCFKYTSDKWSWFIEYNDTFFSLNRFGFERKK